MTTTDAPPDSGLPAEAPLPPLGTVGLLRWLWRQLTSMRTALILLFLLALASVPGSVFPQRGNNPLKVDQWIEQNPGTGPVLDRLGFFDVYASAWFAAIYLLLFISLIGCVLPRIGQHWRAMRMPPPPAPRRMLRMDHSIGFPADRDPAAIAADAAAWLRGHRWRVREGEAESGDGLWVAAEKGYLRETGNLVFHLFLIAILIGVAVGGLFGWKGNVIVREGSGFSNTLTQYDAWGGGRLFSADALAPFSFTLDTFRVDFERGPAQRGAPRLFEAVVDVRESPAARPVPTTIEVNHPLDIGGARVYLVGHGYAPRIVVRDARGSVVFDDTVVFLPQDGNFTSTGVVKVPDSDPSLGFTGLFLPTADFTPERGGFSSFPAPDDPELLLAAFRGDLGMDSGVPQSVYSLDTKDMVKIGLQSLTPGDVWVLPGGSGTVEFAGLERWASFQIAYDPGKGLTLVAVVIAMAGLIVSLFVRRRRMWVKALPREEGGTLVEVAALAKTESADPVTDLSALSVHLGGPQAHDIPDEGSPS